MDILSHSLLGAAVVADKNLLLPALVFGAGPDLLNGLPTHLYMIRKLRAEGKEWPEVFRSLVTPYEWQKAPSWTHTLYLNLHSLFFAFLLAGALYFFYPAWLILMKAWFLHIGLDFFLHRGWFGIKPFYPLSNYQFNLVNWFETPLKYLALPLSLIVFIAVYFSGWFR